MNRFFLFFLLFSLPIFPASAQTVDAGSLIRCPDYSSVYYLADDETRWVFPDEKTYFTWYEDFDDVEMISCTELAQFPIGEIVPYQAGTRLLKLQSAPTVYAVEPGGILRAIPSEESAISLYGSDWASRVNDLSDGFFSAYTVDDPLDEGEVPVGTTLADTSDDGSVAYYYQGWEEFHDVTSLIDEAMRQWVISLDDLPDFDEDVFEMDDEDWEDYSDLAFRDDEFDEGSEDSEAWEQRVDNAFVATDCVVEDREYPEGYYTGPLIDTHLHIANIPDADLDTSNEELLEEADTRPSLGVNVTIPEIACVLQQEGTTSAVSFFPVYPDVENLAEHMVEVADRTMELYPNLFIPFIMPPDDDGSPDGFPTVDSPTLEDMLAFAPDLFVGYGEIGLYERNGGAPELLPDADRLMDIYPVLEDNHIAVYFHPGEQMDDNLADVLEQYPDVNFIVHGDQIQPDIIDLMDEYTNLFFTMNDLYGDEWLLRDEVGKDGFMDYFEEEGFDSLIRQDLALYEDMINAHPDRFMWGTDRGGQSLWTYDVEVGQMLSDYGRAFIGSLDEDVQENFAYKNAQRIFE